MKILEISKDEFKQRLEDPRPAAVRERIKEFEKIIDPLGFNLRVNERLVKERPYHTGVWSMQAMARELEPQKAVEHKNLQKVRVAYYRVFTHFEREQDITIIRNDETINGITWHIHFN